MSNGLTTSQKVLVWAQGKLGRKIGRGECWDLGEEALKQAGAMTSNDLGPVEEDSDYVWGDPIADLKDVQPGDILQLRDHEATTSTETEYTWPDGTVETISEESTVGRPHHTAIVASTRGADGSVRTLEQNTDPGGRIVQNLRIATRDVAPVTTTGTVRRTNPTSKRTETAKVKKTVTVKVTGSIWAYRPKPK